LEKNSKDSNEMKKLLFLVGLLVALLSASCGGQSQAEETSPAPDFTLPNALGGDVSLKDYNGRNVLLFFHMAVG
jgi:cytochrome oxidase Cu insertion factor (SCO1/SenC/PrrC family)